jgi:hypothetical protein
MDIYQTKLVEDKLQGIIDRTVNSSDQDKPQVQSINQFFPNVDLRKLTVLIQRISQEKNITPQDLDKYSRKYIRQNNKILTDMNEEDLIEIVAQLLKDRDQENEPASVFHSPFEIYARNYLQIIEKHQEEKLDPEKVYSETNRVDKEIAKIDQENREINHQDKRKKLHKKLANLELEVKSNFTSVEELKQTKAKMIEAGFAI